MHYPQIYTPALVHMGGLSLVQNFSWTQSLDDVPTAELAVSIEDPALRNISCGMWLRLWDVDRPMGFYRIRAIDTAYHDQGGTVTLQLDHGQAELMDDMLAGTVSIIDITQAGWRTLFTQTVTYGQGIVSGRRRWQLDASGFTRVRYSAENINLLSLIYGIAACQPNDWQLHFDSTDPGGNWTISLGTCGAETATVQAGRNLLSIRRTEDSSATYARIYPTGTDADGNEINIADVNGGVKYLQDTSGGPYYGVGHVELEIANANDLLAKAQQLIAVCNKPRVTYEIECIDLYPETGDPNDLILPGKSVRVIDPLHNLNFTAICESVSKSDAWNRPGEMSVTLRTGTRRQKTLIETLADKTLETGGTTLG